jgi:hypothetical protein
MSCTNPTYYFTDSYYGMDSSKAADYPNSVTAFGNRVNSYDSDVTLSVSSYVGSIQYANTYTADTAGT